MAIKERVVSKTCFDWLYLCLLDSKFVKKYNSSSFWVTSQLKLYQKKIIDEEILEKRKKFSTFHISNVFLQPQY